MKKIMIYIGAGLILLISLVFLRRITKHDYITPETNLSVTSKAFKEGGIIPVKYTGRGEDVSPPLEFGTIDEGARTIAIIMDDMDHPLGMYNHWVIWNIPAHFTSIPEGIPREEIVPSLGDAVQGKSEYGGRHWYRGPKPPFGTHRYVFKVYVLDTVLDLGKDADKSALQKAMEGHVLQYGTLTGVFGS